MRDVLRRRWERSALNRVDRVGKTLLRLAENLRAIGRRRKQWDDPLRSFERQVRRFAQLPVASAIIGEPLLRADAVNRQLQRAAALRGPSELVVNQTEGPVLEQIQPIRFAFERHRARPLARRDHELAYEPVLEQAMNDR